MTTPDERRRNLIWGLELLEEFSSDASLEAVWRGEAVKLLKAYPPLEFLRQFDAANPQELEPFYTVLLGAKGLFQRVGASPRCSEQRRYSLRVVLRHFG
jgi:hypothetical protein